MIRSPGSPERFGELRAANRRRDERFAHHVRGIERIRRLRVLVHHAREQVLVEAAPVDADANRLAVVDCPFDHHRELRIVPAAPADVAGIDPVLCQRARAIREIAEELVAVEMEIADQRHVASERVEPLANGRHGRRGFGGIDGDAHQFRPGIRQRLDLRDGCGNVGGVGVRHRLNDDRRAAADANAADECDPRPVPRDRRSVQRAHCGISHAMS